MKSSSVKFTQICAHASKLVVEHGSLESILGAPFKIFNKYVKVFDLYFVATPTSADHKLLHGASVFYQYIDSNDDGLPDNELAYKKLVEKKATMVMFRDEKELEKKESFFYENERGLNILVQDLESDEACPGSKDPEYFDASLEECFHLVTNGYAEAYPTVFGLERGSKVAQAMDKARGGDFKKIPRKYPKNAWFTYYDKTCDYDCMITEYIYWAMTSILGAQAYRASEIKDEWKLPDRDSVEKGDPDVFRLLTDSQYKLPTVCPQKIDSVPAFDPDLDDVSVSSSQRSSVLSRCRCGCR
jgi:hypothetical protein